jgi:DNA polymerase-3 subunit alpha
VDLRLCNKRVIEALICAGALDGFAPRGRAQLMAALESTFAAAQDVQRERESQQGGLFDLMDGGTGPALIQEPPLPSVEPWSEGDRLQREKEILGFFISGHPLDKYREDIALFDRVNTGNLKEHRDQKVELACVITEVSRQISKRDGAEWGRITVEDYYGTATVLAFGESWQQNKELLQKDTPVLLRGAVSGRDRDEEDPPIFLDGVVPMASVRESGVVGVCIELASHDCDAERIQRAKGVLAGSPGPAPLVVTWRNGGEEDLARLRSRSLRIAPRPDVLQELRDVLGEERVRLVKA